MKLRLRYSVLQVTAVTMLIYHFMLINQFPLKHVVKVMKRCKTE